MPAGGVLENDIDLNRDPLSAQLVAGVSHGGLSLQADGSFVYQPDEGFSGTDGFLYAASDGSLSSAAVTVEIEVTDPPAGYDVWKDGVSWGGGDDGADGDPDRDGVANFLEYAFGMDPLVADRSGLPKVVPRENGVDFVFENARAGVSYEVLLSTDLADWSDPPFAVLDDGSETPVFIPESEAGGGRVFVRLRVTE